jgi:Domain of unknown function (DUF4440)
MVLVPVLVLLLQAPTSIKAAEAEKERFLGLETRVSGAIQTKNTAALDELLAKDFAFSLSLEGRAPEVMNRDEFLKASGYYTLTGFAIQHLSARVFGNTAVVRLQPYRQATAGTTVDRSGEFAVVDVWTKDGDAWKLSGRYVARPDPAKR